MTTLASVRIGDCPHPDLHKVDPEHGDGHHVFVARTISLEGGIKAEQVMLEVAAADHPTKAEQTRALTYAWAPVFVEHGAKDWDLCDEHGEPRPFDLDELLGDYSMARLVANKCGELGYGSAVLVPFQSRPPKPSRTGSTRATTSRRRSTTTVSLASP